MKVRRLLAFSAALLAVVIAEAVTKAETNNVPTPSTQQERSISIAH